MSAERAARPATGLDPAVVAAMACPDCAATLTPYQWRPGIWSVRIEHDDSCPIWQAIQRARRQRQQ